MNRVTCGSWVVASKKGYVRRLSKVLQLTDAVMVSVLSWNMSAVDTSYLPADVLAAVEQGINSMLPCE